MKKVEVKQISFLEKIRPLVDVRVEAMKNGEGMMPECGTLEVKCGNVLDMLSSAKNATIITEIKFSSPSKGRIYEGSLDHVKIAHSYVESGSTILSVLTEPHKFGGDINYIADIRKALPGVHILLKDFVCSKEQIAQAKNYGADLILLIVAFLSKKELQELYDYALSLDLTPLLEVHAKEELSALKETIAEPALIGINNRNLKTLAVDMNTSRALVQDMPKSAYVVCESGIDSKEVVVEMCNLGFNLFLVGGALMEHDDPGTKLRELDINNVVLPNNNEMRSYV